MPLNNHNIILFTITHLVPWHCASILLTVPSASDVEPVDTFKKVSQMFCICNMLYIFYVLNLCILTF